MNPSNAAIIALGKRIRLRRGTMTQRELAELASVEMITISRIERGKVDPTFSRLQRIAAALRVPLSELFDHDDPGPIGGVGLIRSDINGLRNHLTRIEAKADEVLLLAHHSMETGLAKERNP